MGTKCLVVHELRRAVVLLLDTVASLQSLLPFFAIVVPSKINLPPGSLSSNYIDLSVGQFDLLGKEERFT